MLALARECLDEAERVAPGDPLLWCQRAHLFLAQAQHANWLSQDPAETYARGIESASRALELDANRPSFHLVRGLLCEYRADWSHEHGGDGVADWLRAQADYSEACRKYHGLSGGWFGLGRVSLRLARAARTEAVRRPREFHDALAAFATALESNPRDPWVHHARALAIPEFLPPLGTTDVDAMRLWDLAETDLLCACRLDPRNAMMHLDLARVCTQRNRGHGIVRVPWRRALWSATRAIALAPAWGKAYWIRGWLRTRAREVDWQEARADLETAEALDPRTSENLPGLLEHVRQRCADVRAHPAGWRGRLQASATASWAACRRRWRSLLGSGWAPPDDGSGVNS